jgi:hypothetical protein
MSLNKTFLASITKLNGQNWHSWSKEMETYLTMEEFWELIDPAEMPFINDVLSVVRQLKSIKCKPQNNEITDKLLIGLHLSFAAVCTKISLHTPEPSIKEITATLKDFEDNKTLCPSFSTPIDSTIKDESALYANKECRHGSRGGGSKPKIDDDFDWGNSKGQDGVCF